MQPTMQPKTMTRRGAAAITLTLPAWVWNQLEHRAKLAGVSLSKYAVQILLRREQQENGKQSA